MGWSDDFREQIDSGGPTPMYALDFSVWADMCTWSNGDVVLYSHEAAGATGGAMGGALTEISHAIGDSIRVAGHSVNLRTWESRSGGMQVTLASMSAARWVARNVPKGSVALLKVGFPGWPFEDWQTVAAGQFRGLSGARQDWSMEFSGAFDALQSPRLGVGVSSMTESFNGAGSISTTADGAWTVGATLPVNDNPIAAGFVKDAGTGAAGLLYCTPTVGEPFYLKWTNEGSAVPSSTTSFTVKDTDVLGTTRVNLADGDAITHYGYVFNPVRNLYRNVLTSASGAALPGLGTLPDDWGLGVGRSLFNTEDVEHWTFSPDIGTDFRTDFIVGAPLDDPWKQLRTHMAKFGYWLVWKEDGISHRFVLDPHGAADMGWHIADTITDADIVSVENFSMYSQDAPVEYQRYRGVDAYKSEAPPASLPAVKNYHNDVLTEIFDDPSTHATNRSNANGNLNARVGPWYLRVPCSLELNLRGWRFASLVPGDWVRVSSSMIPDFYQSSGTIDGRAFMVTSAGIDWAGTMTRVTLSTIPPRSIPTDP